MTPEETKQAAQVMLAWAEGKTIEVISTNDTCNDWRVVSKFESPMWDWYKFEYRVKKEPRKFYVVYNSKGEWIDEDDQLDRLQSRNKGDCFTIVSFTEDSQ